MRTLILSIIANGFLIGCSHLSPDNIIEDSIEDLIEYETGFIVEFTPENEQKQK